MTPRPSKVLKDKYDVIVIFRLLDIALNTWTLNYVQKALAREQALGG